VTRRVPRIVLGVDGGNSKTDVLLATAAGAELATLAGPTVSHQQVGLEAGMARLAQLVAEVRHAAGIAPPVRVASAVLALAGADYPSDERRLTAAVSRLRLADTVVVVNDTWAGLRAGTDRGWGIVLVCGAGTNAAGLAPDGRRWRFPAVGDYAGDWGGGGGIGLAGLRAAIRGRDGRGPRTALSTAVPTALGRRRLDAVTRAFYDEHLRWDDIRGLAPVVFEAAMGGDAVARAIVDRQADELAAMATTVARRLRLTRLDPEVVLAGGVFRTPDAAFAERLEAGIRRAIPRALLVRTSPPPVVGAARLAADALRSTARVPLDPR
jgi:N-acetylglucosamine kinase-like BadF-type ATPase